jgi:hypothetical protein
VISHNNGVKVFRFPNTLVCTFMLGLDDEHPLCFIQLEVELHSLVEHLISYVSAEACENLYLM